IDIMEGLLYIAGDVGLTEEQLIMHVPITKEQLHKEVEAYDRPNVKIKRRGESFFLETTPEMEKYIRRLLDERPASKRSQASLEVLSIVAYNQPGSRRETETQTDRAASARRLTL